MKTQNQNPIHVPLYKTPLFANRTSTSSHFSGSLSFLTQPPLSRIPSISRIPSLSFSFFLVCLTGTFNAFQELANSQEILAEITEPKPPTSSKKSQEVVLAFYEALKSRDVDTVHKILARDLEWWFHGPPSHQFMMRLLTGEQKDSDVPFEFSPISITPFGNIVVAEGFDTSRPISWVHAWTVTDGIITQVREYFNTSLTVTRLGNQSQPSDFKSKSSTTTEITPVHCPPVWESSLSDQIGKSVPGLVLAI